MKRQSSSSTTEPSRKISKSSHDKTLGATSKQLPFSTWLNSAVLFNVYSFLEFRDVLTFRLVNHTINEELRISSNSNDELFIMNRLYKIVVEMKDKSLNYFNGGLLRVNAEIRNCMLLSGGDDHDEYFEHLFENCGDLNNQLKNNSKYLELFEKGKISFYGFIGGVYSQTQGGRCILKVLKKSSNNENSKKEFIYFTQHFVYGPNTRIDNLERSYLLKVRDDSNSDGNKVLISYLNSYYTWQDEPTAEGKIDSKAIEKIMLELDIPYCCHEGEWNWKDFLEFLMVCAGAAQYSCDDLIVDQDRNIWKTMMRELKNSQDNVIADVKEESAVVPLGCLDFEELIKPIIEPSSSSSLTWTQKMDHLNAIRSQIVKKCASISNNSFSFEQKYDTYDPTINESMLAEIKSRLKYYTKHESCTIGFTEYIQEERLIAEAVFDCVDGTRSTICFKYDMLYTYLEPSTSITITIDDGFETHLHDLILQILGIDLENDEEEDEEKILTDFSKCLLKLFGQCHTVLITESKEDITTNVRYPHSLIETVELMNDI